MKDNVMHFATLSERLRFLKGGFEEIIPEKAEEKPKKKTAKKEAKSSDGEEKKTKKKTTNKKGAKDEVSAK